MSKSAILSSSIAKKYWMALTGLFLCLFLVGHLLGNLQLIFITGEEGKRAFNEYAYFMTHNPAVKVLSYLTYISILFHAIDGLILAIQNKKARPQNYAYNKPSANSGLPSRYMAILGTVVLVFICTHMVNFWGKMHFETLPLHTIEKPVEYNVGQNPQTGEMMTNSIDVNFVLTTNGEYKEYSFMNPRTNEEEILFDVKNDTELYDKKTELKTAEGYKDLHGLVLSFFGKNQSGHPENPNAVVFTLLYVISMAVLAFHLWHGFSSAFQSLGFRVKSYAKPIEAFGKLFAILVPALFAIIPIVICFL